MPAAAHAIEEWLPRSATFVANTVRNQRRYTPVVLADHVTNLAEFPADPVVELLAPVSPPRRLAEGFRARASGARSRYDWRVARAAREHDCAVIHAHFGPMGCRVLDARAQLGLPLVTTFYGYDLAWADEHPEWRERYARLFREGTLFVCEGPAMAQHLASIGCAPERIRVVKIGIELAKLPFAARTPARPLILVATGRFVPKKGLDLAIRAFAAARERIGASELWLVGDGPQRAELEGLAAELGVADSVRFRGMVGYDEYTQIMERAHIGLQPSRTAPDGDTEGGAPTVIIEMQAAGIPVVSTRHADIPAVHAHPGELVAEDDVEGLSDALVRVASLTAEEWRERTEAARAFVETEHAAAVTAAQLESLYDEAVETG